MKRRSKVGTLIQMLGLVKPLAGYMCLAVVCGSLAYLAVQFIPILGGYVIVSGLNNITTNLTLIWVLLFAFAMVRAVLRYVEQRTNHYIAFTLLAIVRDKVFKALRRLSPAKLEGRDKGNLISLITSDIELLEVFYAHTISPICIAIVVETFMVIFISKQNITLGLIALVAFVCVGVLVPMIISRVSGNVGQEVRGLAGNLATYVLENLRGVDEIIQYQSGEERLEGMNNKTDTLVLRQGQLNKLTGLNIAIANTFILFFDVLMVIVALGLFKNGDINMEACIISIFALMSSFGPVTALAGLGTTLENTIASANRVLDIMEEEPETLDIVGKKDVEFSGAEVRDITFAYNKEEVLKDFSLNIIPKKIIGIIGKSGSGKSTLLKLLMRFWQVNKGNIFISNTDIEDINTTSLRAMESYMTQDTQLFKDTIANNVRIAKLDATDEEIVEACKKASIHDFIMTLPNGYETNVGELGEMLSGGERQRIGLARAFLHDASLILLDEPTSNLDSLNEAIILKALKQEARDKTVVLVSHRPSTARIADTQFQIDQGRIS